MGTVGAGFSMSLDGFIAGPNDNTQPFGAGEASMGAESAKHNVVVTRVFDAPVEQVWNAWVEPEMVMQWWGPTGFTCPLARMDFREGGTSLVCMRAPKEFGGQELYNTWTYTKIAPMQRIEFIQHFADKDGNQTNPATHGLPPDVPREVPHVLIFKAVGDNRTEVTVTEYGYPSAQFVVRLVTYRSPEKQQGHERSFKPGEDDEFVGVRMGQVFALAKEFMAMPLDEIEKLLESPIHKVRVGAVSIMDWQARSKKTPESRRKELFDLYIRRHDRINNWDLVDRSAIYVVGSYLFDKPRDILYQLARSENIWERRTAILSTGYFIRQGDVDDTFRIAEMLLADDQDLIHKATGWMLREAGKKDRQRLLAFLDQYAATMPRTALRYAIEHLDKEQRSHYMGLKKAHK